MKIHIDLRKAAIGCIVVALICELSEGNNIKTEGKDIKPEGKNIKFEGKETNPWEKDIKPEEFKNIAETCDTVGTCKQQGRSLKYF